MHILVKRSKPEAADVDVLVLTHDAFQIRMHNPGEPVEILFKPATAENIP